MEMSPPSMEKGLDYESLGGAPTKSTGDDLNAEAASPISSSALDIGMEEMMDLDQILADIASYDQQSIVNNNSEEAPANKVDEPISSVDNFSSEPSGDFISSEAWTLLGELDALNAAAANSTLVDDSSSTPVINDTNDSTPRPQFNVQETMLETMDCFQDPEFYDSSVVRDTLSEMMTAPDSADCTVVNNPLITYLLDEKSSHHQTSCFDDLHTDGKFLSVEKSSHHQTSCFDDLHTDGKFLSVSPIKRPETQITQHTSNGIIVTKNKRHLRNFSPLVLPSPSSNTIKEQVSEPVRIPSPLAPPQLVQPETSVSIDNLLAVCQQQAAAPAAQPVVAQPVNLILRVVGTDGQLIDATTNQAYNIILEQPLQPLTVPTPSPSPALSVASTSSSVVDSRHRRKREASDSEDFEPSTSKRRRGSEPDEQSKYLLQRHKNNEASKRSRQNRREKEKMMSGELEVLEKQNKELKQKLELLENLVKRVKTTVMDAIAKNVKSN